MNVADSRNCANKIKVCKKLVVLICTKNAAITILRRYPDGSINTAQPLVYEKGLPGNWGNRDFTGLTVGFIEYSMNTYVFISQTSIAVNLPKVWMWEIIMRDLSMVQIINYSQDFSNLYEKQIEINRGKRSPQFINLAASDKYLVMNHEYLDRFDVIIFCGLDQHFDF